ncbi:Myb-like DNA-binding domain containing protein [Trichomonas vaginalis G3]|uniref:Myb-like DNA-binding domain containing protein n=1 Tax=Trichomonas vaginalis (strain ATCC PRA-98 / G3) TaxID=412133 RepID=A2GCU1_TRIV3|nr:RNA polymerase II transcription regulator recruiting protein [Trichomonas vaginalis G3]EAX85025.1 Myb-like DNA-binding domain containing protein [Trichomonas vaginalis G3]KAI5495970.1 RNA polymerase II transcription regulator recruiting protein [Trichomonas vaginalis G3]|eukprot:XP_001297955.1 Myb-like DNA-binding domain containing protein [Trichomonas vaginalis G3]
MPVYNRFTQQEDDKLVRLVEEYGTKGNWKMISKKMHGRSPRQCMDRYVRFLDPSVNKDPWTPEEDKLLLELVPKLSPKWRQISLFFRRRNDIQCRNRYRKLCYELSKEKPKLEEENSNNNQQPSKPEVYQAFADLDFSTDLFSFGDESNNFGIFGDLF